MAIIIDGNNTPTAGAVAVGNGTTLGFTSAGTSGQVLTSNGTGVPTWTDNGSGTVTSVGGTGTVSGLSLSGTVTTSGNLTLGGTLAVTPSNFSSQTANYILAAPNGVSGTPTFRAIVAADIPTLNQNTTGTAANVTGTVAIANGGTGATTRQDAMDALAGSTTSGSYLRGNGTDVVMSAIQVSDIPTLNQNTTGTAAGLSATLVVGSGGTGATTLTGILKGNGTSAFTAATAGTDYVAPATATTFTALQSFNTFEVTKTQEVYQTLTQASSGTLTINFNSGNVVYLNQGANITGFTLQNIPSGKAFSFNIIRKNTAGTALTITWGATFKWPSGGTTPTLTNTTNAIDIFTFITFDGGTTVYSISSGTNFA